MAFIDGKKYIKINKIWGSKVEGWNAFVVVFDNKVMVNSFTASLPFSESISFKKFYAHIEPILKEKGFNVTSDIDAPVKRTRKKKDAV